MPNDTILKQGDHVPYFTEGCPLFKDILCMRPARLKGEKEP